MRWPRISRMGTLGGVIAALSLVILVQAGVMWSLRAKAQPAQPQDQAAQQAQPAAKPDQPGTKPDQQNQALDPFEDLLSDPFFSGQADAFDHMRKMQARMDRLFARTIQRFDQLGTGMVKPGSPSLGRTTSGLQLKEEDDRYVLKTELPGVAEPDLKVDIKDGRLTIRGRRQYSSGSTDPKADESDAEVRTERFEQSISLPDDIDTARVKVDFHDGLLKVVLPKTTH